MGSPGVVERLRDEGLRLGARALGRVLENPGRAQVMVDAVRRVRDGGQDLEDGFARLRNLADLPSRNDLQDLAKTAGRLRRDVNKLRARLEALASRLDP